MTTSDIVLNGHAIQCRITTEDPQNNFIPDYGRITAYRGATGHGIRLDGGTAYSGRGDHPLLRQPAREGDRLGADAGDGDRRASTGRCASSASEGFRPTSPSSRISLKHPTFLDNCYTTKFIDETPELHRFAAAPRPGDQDPDLHRRHHRQRPSGNRRPAEAAGRGAGAAAAGGGAGPAAGGHAADAGGARAEGGGRLDAGRDAGARHRHHHARRPPEPARHPHALVRHDPGGAGLCGDAADALLGGVLGRRDLRRRLPLPAGMPVAAAARPAQGDAEPDDADAAPRLERGRLHQLSRQRGRSLRGAGGRLGGGRLPRLRQPATGSRTCASPSTR